MSPTAVPVDQAWLSSIQTRMPRLPSVRGLLVCTTLDMLILSAAKFTGYMYGGRPLGLTYVKYTNANGQDAMDGQEATGGLTQDQMM